MASQWTIVKGPSKWDLMISLLHESRDDRHDYRHIVTFEVVGGGRRRLQIIGAVEGIRRGDDSGGACDEWLIEFFPYGGFYYKEGGEWIKLELADWRGIPDVRIQYSTKTRLGSLRLIRSPEYDREG